MALSRYLRPSSSLHELLDVRRAEDLPAGSFKVEACSEDGFYFQVLVAPDLFPFLQNAGDHKNHRDSLLTHVTSRCFEILKGYPKDQGEDEEDSAWWEKDPAYRPVAVPSFKGPSCVVIAQWERKRVLENKPRTSLTIRSLSTLTRIFCLRADYKKEGKKVRTESGPETNLSREPDREVQGSGQEVAMRQYGGRVLDPFSAS